MKTKYLTNLRAVFNPLSPVRAHKTPRILLSFVPPSSRGPGGTTVETIVLPSSSSTPASISLTFKDGKVMEFVERTRRGSKKQAEQLSAESKEVVDLAKIGIDDVLNEVERHTRVLARKDELTGG